MSEPVRDWAWKCAQKIRSEHRGCQEGPTQERVVAIIELFAEPLITLLRDSRREHLHCDDSWYCCPLCDSPDHGGEHPGHHKEVCTCGAEAWNERVNRALDGDLEGQEK